MIAFLRHPWPWYVAGPLIGLFVPALLVVGNKSFGISSNLRHLCAAVAPRDVAFFRYDWRRTGGWNLAFALGIILGGVVAGTVLANPEAVHLSACTSAALDAFGVHDRTGLAPRELFSWAALLTARGLVAIVGGGLLVGFGAAYAGGCTSGHAIAGHAIAGLADFQLPSLIAVLGFVAGGLAASWLLLPALR